MAKVCDGDPNINRLTLTQEIGGFLNFDDFVNAPEAGNHGSYLSVFETVWEARSATIVANMGESIWFEGKVFVEFKIPQDLTKAYNCKNPSRFDPSMYGG